MKLEPYVNYITDLLSSFLKDGSVKPYPQNLNADYFLKFCRFHKLESIAYLALKNTDIPQNLRQSLEQLYYRSIAILAKQQYYLEKVENAFENAGIDYFVMKGRELAKLYPSEDMRQSSDIDIYVGEKNTDKAHDIMINLGFIVKDYLEDERHDQYIADKIVLCELHKVLIQDDYSWKDECNKIAERVIKCDENNHCYKMSKEDFYIFNVAHAAKHFKNVGIGIRMFVDLWMIYSKYKDEFDYTYLNEKLELCHLKRFEECSRELFMHWFEGRESFDDTIKAMGKYVIESGWLGTYQQFSSEKLAKNANETSSVGVAKIKSYMNIIFPSYQDMVSRYPIVQKHKVLIPFCQVYRIFKAVFGKDKAAKKIITEINYGDLEKGKNILKLKSDIGL